MTKVAICTGDLIGPSMSGPAIRAGEIAAALAPHCDVRLVTTQPASEVGAASAAFETLIAAKRDELSKIAGWADVILLQGYVLDRHPWLVRADVVIVVDLYDPFHLEQLERGRSTGEPLRTLDVADTVGVLNHQMRRGDFFICASERQRDFWIGHLAAVGRVNPANYERDPGLRRLIDVVPFGTSVETPVRKAPAGPVVEAGSDEFRIVWGGGLYPWYDVESLLHAVAKVAVSHPRIRLILPTGRHPNPAVNEAPYVGRVRQLSDDLGLTGKQVTFLEEWVPYDQRSSLLVDAQLGVSVHRAGVETDFAFRTRILDYIWAGLPILATAGDELAEMIRRESMGLVVPPGDVRAIAAGLERLITDGAFREECGRNARAASPQLSWPRAVAPLLAFCQTPSVAPDRQAAGTRGLIGGAGHRWRVRLLRAFAMLGAEGWTATVARIRAALRSRT